MSDELSSRLLIELKEVICYPVMMIIAESLRSGIVPDAGKLQTLHRSLRIVKELLIIAQ